jgi:hypothetical protein
MAPERQTPPYVVERNFGLIVGGLFVALGGWWLFRGKFHVVAPGLLALGSLLVLFAAAFPKALVIPNRLWMALAEALSFIMTRVVLVIVFFVIATPIGILRKLTGGDPLRRRAPDSESYWRPYGPRQNDPRHYEKMY